MVKRFPGAVPHIGGEQHQHSRPGAHLVLRLQRRSGNAVGLAELDPAFARALIGHAACPTWQEETPRTTQVMTEDKARESYQQIVDQSSP